MPAFLRRLAELETLAGSGLADVLAASDLDPENFPGRRHRLVFALLDPADATSHERRLRLAITRVLGKPTGGDRHWDAGCAAVSLADLDDRVTLLLTPQLSMSNLRTAAVHWLDGNEVRDWLVASGFVDHATEPDADGSWPQWDGSVSRASVWTPSDGTVRVKLYLESGVRPPGTKGSTDDERWTDTLAYLADGLGPPDRPGWWRRGSRSFRIEGMRSSTRSITLAQAPPGEVHGPLGRRSRIPTTPDPDPAVAARLVRVVADLRGATLDLAVGALVAAGVVTDDPPRLRTGGAVLRDHAGHPVELGLVDGRLERAAVEATSATTWDAVVSDLDAQFGAISESHGFDRRWRLGSLVVRHAGRTGDDGVERLRVAIGEDTAPAVGSASSWLVDGKPFEPVSLSDEWHARCVGAAVSAAVVPAVVPGQPVWRVGERILWLDGDGLHAAGPGTWPAWAAGMPAGGEPAPMPAVELAAFLDGVAGWRAATPEDAAALLRDLGWTTADPDVVSRRTETTAAVCVRRPAGSGLSMWLVDDRIRSWRLDLTHPTDPDATPRTARVLDGVLAPYAGGTPDEGWSVGAFRVGVSHGLLPGLGPTIGLEGTVST